MEVEDLGRYDEEKPESTPIPGGFTDRLSIFEQLLILRCCRIDRITVALTVCITSFQYIKC